MTRHEVRLASAVDAVAIGRLLHDFNVEFDEPTPPAAELAERMVVLMTQDTCVLLAGDPPDADGVAVLRFRPAIWSRELECYLAELYVVPDKRGDGIGRALMLAAMDEARDRGAGYMDLSTEETDVAARALYESLGFRNRRGGGDGAVSYYYEREL
jgi:ribosomal protein S18 acetylase RimI-like enzyme